LCGEKSAEDDPGEEQRNYYTTKENRVVVDPVITRASLSTCGENKKERKTKCIVIKAPGLES